MTDYRALIERLVAHGVRFIIVGGAAATAHGSARLTYDLDIVYSRAPDNIAKIVDALAPLEPYLRGAPPGLPFVWDESTIRRGTNFTLSTTAGDIDLLGEIPGGGSYEELQDGAVRIELFGMTCLCLSLEQLICAKRAAGRPRDLEAIAELEAILARRQGGHE